MVDQVMHTHTHTDTHICRHTHAHTHTYTHADTHTHTGLHTTTTTHMYILHSHGHNKSTKVIVPKLRSKKGSSLSQIWRSWCNSTYWYAPQAALNRLAFTDVDGVVIGSELRRLVAYRHDCQHHSHVCSAQSKMFPKVSSLSTVMEIK